MSEEKFTIYMLEYMHKGSRWGLNIPAEDEEDLRERLRRLQYAPIVGTDPISIPDSSPTFPFVPILAWIRNRLSELRRN